MGIQAHQLKQLELLYTDALGEVYLAELTQGDASRMVRMTIIRPSHLTDRSFVQKLIRESKTSSAISHPKILDTLELVIDDTGRYFLVSEHIPTTRLVDVLQSRPRCSLEAACGIMVQVLEALYYAHRTKGDSGVPLRYIHGDVSPFNIEIADRGDVLLSRYGLSDKRLLGEQRDEERTYGRIGYCSPEQFHDRHAGPGADIYAAGIVFYELLMGEPLLSGPDFRMLETARVGFVPPARAPQRIPQALWDIVLKTMSHTSGDRVDHEDELRPFEAPYRDAAALRKDIIETMSRLGVRLSRGLIRVWLSQPRVEQTGFSELSIARNFSEMLAQDEPAEFDLASADASMAENSFVGGVEKPLSHTAIVQSEALDALDALQELSLLKREDLTYSKREDTVLSPPPRAHQLPQSPEPIAETSEDGRIRDDAPSEVPFNLKEPPGRAERTNRVSTQSKRDMNKVRAAVQARQGAVAIGDSGMLDTDDEMTHARGKVVIDRSPRQPSLTEHLGNRVAGDWRVHPNDPKGLWHPERVGHLQEERSFEMMDTRPMAYRGAFRVAQRSPAWTGGASRTILRFPKRVMPWLVMMFISVVGLYAGSEISRLLIQPSQSAESTLYILTPDSSALIQWDNVPMESQTPYFARGVPGEKHLLRLSWPVLDRTAEFNVQMPLSGYDVLVVEKGGHITSVEAIDRSLPGAATDAAATSQMRIFADQPYGIFSGDIRIGLTNGLPFQLPYGQHELKIAKTEQVETLSVVATLPKQSIYLTSEQ